MTDKPSCLRCGKNRHPLSKVLRITSIDGEPTNYTICQSCAIRSNHDDPAVEAILQRIKAAHEIEWQKA